MSAARYSGTGAQAASANSTRSPAANACRNFIGSREMAGRRRIPMLRRTSPGPTVRSRALCHEYDGGGFVPRRRQDFCFEVGQPRLQRLDAFLESFHGLPR